MTYYRPEDALKAIQAVNNIFIDGRTLKASLGTTKYCSHFMKNQSCPKHDCMYLHELGDEAASFTKEEMQQGKHTDYEKALHDEMIKANNANAAASTAAAATGSASPPSAAAATDTKAAAVAAAAPPSSSTPAGDGSDQVVNQVERLLLLANLHEWFIFNLYMRGLFSVCGIIEEQSKSTTAATGQPHKGKEKSDAQSKTSRSEGGTQNGQRR